MSAILLTGISSATQAIEVSVGVSNQNQGALGYQNGKFIGSLAGFYQCSFDQAGLKYTVSLLPQSRILYLLERGEIDIGLPLVELPARSRFAVFARPLFEVPFYLYSRKKIDLHGDLSKLRFVVLRASAGIELIKRRGVKFQEVASWSQAIDLARLSRFDGAIVPAPLVPNLAPAGLAGLHRSDFDAIPNSMYVSAKSRNVDQIVVQINTAIDSCKR